MRYILVLFLFVAATLAHAQSMLGQDVLAFETAPAQSETMACCDDATGAHSTAFCATYTIPALPQATTMARAAGRQMFVISDWRVADLRAAPPEGPPRSV